MKIFEGRELFELIKMCKNLIEAQTCTVMPILVYLHTHEIFHCDLKPESTLFYRADSDLLKVIDFGLYKAILEDTGALLKSRIGISNYFAAKMLCHN